VDVKSLSHTKWNCKYQRPEDTGVQSTFLPQAEIMNIVFAPKLRRKATYVEIKENAGKILRQL